MKVQVNVDRDVYEALPDDWREEAKLEYRLEEAINAVLFDANVEADVEIEVE